MSWCVLLTKEHTKVYMFKGIIEGFTNIKRNNRKYKMINMVNENIQKHV